MKPEEITLDNVNKLFEYERQSRQIDLLDLEESRNFAKLYCKLYLKQQELISSIGSSMGLL